MDIRIIRKRSIVLFLLFFSLRLVTDGQAQWKSADTWKLYNVGNRAFKIVLDSVGRYKSYRLNDDSIRYFLDSAALLPLGTRQFWNGAMLATCMTSGEIRKIDISYSGGFFYDEKTKRYYEVVATKKDEWNGYLSSCLISIQ